MSAIPLDMTPGTCDNPYVNLTANGFRLPTIYEWELAARYINDINGDGDILDLGEYYPGNFASGAALAYTDFNATSLVAWFGNSTTAGTGNTTTSQPVATKTANALGIYDISGNVWEWNFDWKPTFEGNSRELRGGSWGNTANLLQLGYVNWYAPYTSMYHIGFRPARSP